MRTLPGQTIRKYGFKLEKKGALAPPTSRSTKRKAALLRERRTVVPGTGTGTAFYYKKKTDTSTGEVVEHILRIINTGKMIPVTSLTTYGDANAQCKYNL